MDTDKDGWLEREEEVGGGQIREQNNTNNSKENIIKRLTCQVRLLHINK